MKKLLYSLILSALFICLTSCAEVDKTVEPAECTTPATDTQQAAVPDEKVTDLWFIPGYKVIQSDDTVLALVEPFSYQCSENPVNRFQSLVYAVYCDNRLNLVFEGYVEGREPESSYGGGWGDEVEHLTLHVGDEVFTCSGYIEHTDLRLQTNGVTCWFDLPDGTLESGKEYTIIDDRREWLDWYNEIPFTLEPAQKITGLAEIGEYYENDYVDLAVKTELDDNNLSFELYGLPKNDMEIVCIGGDRERFAAGMPIMFTTPEGEFVPQTGPYVVSRLYYPTVRNYDVSGVTDATLRVSSVMLRDRVDKTINKGFATKEEALAYSETIEFEHCILTMNIEDVGGELRLTAVTESTTEGLTTAAVEYNDEENTIFYDPKEENIWKRDKSVEFSRATEELNESLSFEINICGIIYAAETNLEVNASLHLTQPDSFSYAEVTADFKIGDSGVKNDGFVNTEAVSVNHPWDAKLHATKECTIDYDTVTVAFDEEAEMWEVTFSTLNTLGNCQSVYMDRNGVTKLIVYGE